MHIRHFAVSLALAVALVPSGQAFAAPPPSGPDDTSPGIGACVPVSPSQIDRTDETPSCLDLTVTLSSAPKVGGTAVLDIEVRTTRASERSALEVILPANLEWVQAPAGLTRSTVASAVPANRGKEHRATGATTLSRDEPWRLSGVVRAVGTGSTQIIATADGRAPTDTATDSAFLTLGEEKSSTGIKVAALNPSTGAVSEPVRPATNHQPAGSSPSRKAPSSGTACATGSWVYVDHTGTTRPLANAQLQVWDDDGATGDDLLTSGLTSANGGYSLCFDNSDGDGTGQDIYTTVATQNQHWIVQNNTSKNSYAFSSATKANVAEGSSSNFATLQPSDPALMRGLEAFDTINAAWNWTPNTNCWDPRDTTCRRGAMNWAPDSTTCCYYSLAENAAYISAEIPDIPNTVLHEWGHALMDDLYDDDWPPVPNCSPHYLDGASSAGCAWTEGWATWFGSTVLNDPFYRFSSSSFLNLESPTRDSPGWDDGDTVEGRVMGAMWDLADPANESGDTCSEDPKVRLWSTTVNHVSDTFAQFWSQRAADGYPVGATQLACLFHNTIDY